MLIAILLIMKNIAEGKLAAGERTQKRSTHEVNLRFESAALRSFTWAFWVAYYIWERNYNLKKAQESEFITFHWIFSWYRRVYRRLSDWYRVNYCLGILLKTPHLFAHVVHIYKDWIFRKNVSRLQRKSYRTYRSGRQKSLSCLFRQVIIKYIG